MDLALTHISWVRSHPETRSYQRLAFVGSYIAQILLLEDCIKKFGWRVPGRGKETYQKRRHLLASGVFPQVFDDLKLSLYIRAMSTAASITSSIKCDVLQSLLATAFLAEGIDASRKFWHSWIAHRIVDAEAVRSNIDAITTLQEITQGANHQPPEYQVAREPGSPGHQQRFRALCIIDGKKLGEGSGCSKKEAKQAAALRALAELQEFAESRDGASSLLHRKKGEG
jgi:ribonuclease-3